MLALNTIRELRIRPIRTLLALVGVAVTTAMLADMLMLGRGITRSFGDLLESRGYELQLTTKGTLPFDTEATVPGFGALRDSLESVVGVERVAPVLATSIALELDDGTERTVEVVALGMDAGDQSMYRLTDGEPPGPGEVLIDTDAMAALGVAPGSQVMLRLASEPTEWGRRNPATISGEGNFVFASRGDLQGVMRLEDLQEMSSLEDRVSFAMIRIAEGLDPDSVRSAILALTDRTEIVTLDGIEETLDARFSYFRQTALILATVSLVVAALLVSTLSTVSVSERLGLIAALRAIGVSRMRIAAGFAAESAAICAVGGAAGVGLSVVVANYLELILSDFPGLPVAVRFFVVGADSLVTAFALLLVAGTVAGLVPALNATRMEVAAALHKEAP